MCSITFIPLADNEVVGFILPHFRRKDTESKYLHSVPPITQHIKDSEVPSWAL